MEISKEYVKQLVDHDLYTYEHCKNVGCLMRDFATWLEHSPDIVTEAYAAGIWHDIGKLWIPQEMLQKEEQLSDYEWGAIKEHAYLGYFFLDGHESLPGIASYVLYHHERYDGQGYPRGLKRDEIPVISRMLAVCDAFDAMISERPYRMPMTTEEALQELHKETGSKFDPKLVSEFSTWLQQHYKNDVITNSPYRIKDNEQKYNMKSIDDEVESMLQQLPKWLEMNKKSNN